jgi:branched-chain amino acid transport system permease protein
VRSDVARITSEEAGAESTLEGATTTEVVGPALKRVALLRFGWWPFGLLAIVGLLGLQTQLYTGQARTVTTVFMFVALAQGWNIIGGFTGYPCFGQVGFFGLGAYTTAVLMVHTGAGFWLALPVAGIVAGLFAALVGLPLLRLKGHYFAIATLGVAEALREIVLNIPAITGGGAGITMPTIGTNASTGYPGNDGFYVIFLFAAALSVALVALIARRGFGYELRAIHQDEEAAAAAGIRTTRVKVLAFALSAALTGLVGAIYAFQQVTMFPERLFDIDFTVMMVIMVVLGGVGTVGGPIIGATGVVLVSEYLRSHYTNAHTLILGAVIVVAVILVPQGIVRFSREAWRARRISLLDNVRSYRL